MMYSPYFKKYFYSIQEILFAVCDYVTFPTETVYILFPAPAFYGTPPRVKHSVFRCLFLNLAVPSFLFPENQFRFKKGFFCSPPVLVFPLRKNSFSLSIKKDPSSALRSLIFSIQLPTFRFSFPAFSLSPQNHFTFQEKGLLCY